MKLSKLIPLIVLSFVPLFWVQAAPLSVADSLKGLLDDDLDDKKRADVLADLAYELRYINFDSAVHYGSQAIEVAKEAGDQKALAKAHNSLGIVYAKNGSLISAMDEYMASLKIKEELGDGPGVAIMYLNIGEIHFNLRNYEQAQEFFTQAEEGFISENNHQKLSWVYLNLGNVEMSLNRSVEARDYYLKCQSILDTLEKPRIDVMALCLNGIGASYDNDENWIQAEEYGREALKIAEEGKMVLLIAALSNNLAEYLTSQKRYSEALPYLDQAFQLASENSFSQEVANNHLIRAHYYKGIGQMESAYSYMEKCFDLNDSLHQASTQEDLNKMQAAYDYDRQQTKIKLLDQEKASQEAKSQERAALIAALAVGLGLLGILLVVVVLGNRRQRQTNQMLIEKNNLIDNARAVLQDRNAKLEELNREKDGLVHIVAHDLKAPLNKTLALMSMMESDEPLSDVQTQAVSMVKKVNLEAGELIRSLLDVNAIEHSDSDLDIQSLNLNKLVEEKVKEYGKSAADKKIQLDFESPGKEVVIRSDSGAFSRILDNLISNALKFSHSGSRVGLATEMTDAGAVVSVRDEGPGISEEDQKKLFGKFQKLSARPTAGESSTGLGLAIVKALSDQLEGEIEVISELGKGTEFKLTFPVAHSQKPTEKIADPS